MIVWVLKNVLEHVKPLECGFTYKDEILYSENQNVKYCRTFTDLDEMYKYLKRYDHNYIQINKTKIYYECEIYPDFECDWSLWFCEDNQYRDDIDKSLLNKELNKEEQETLKSYFIENMGHIFHG